MGFDHAILAIEARRHQYRQPEDSRLPPVLEPGWQADSPGAPATTRSWWRRSTSTADRPPWARGGCASRTKPTRPTTWTGRRTAGSVSFSRGPASKGDPNQAGHVSGRLRNRRRVCAGLEPLRGLGGAGRRRGSQPRHRRRVRDADDQRIAATRNPPGSGRRKRRRNSR